MPAEHESPAVPRAACGRSRRWWRRACGAFAALAVAYLLTVLAGVPFAWPFDYWVNAGAPEIEATLRLPADGRRRVVILQHGFWRSPLAMLRIERTLTAHGYEVHNLGYPSTTARIQDHAARLRDGIEAVFARGPVDELSFVGHSMGGLVIQEYLRDPAAHQPVACVYIATPHRGAMLADLRKHWFLFRLAMGSESALQLGPGDAFHSQPIPMPGRVGTIVGDLGDGNPSIPGHDDGTVAVAEATLAGANDSVTLPFGHTQIVYHPTTARLVVTFLRQGAFAPVGSLR